MFRFLYQNLSQVASSQVRSGASTTFTNHVWIRFIQSKSPKQTNPTVSYLVNSCGFSLESAISASKKMKIQIKDTERSDSVLDLLTKHGFTKTHIKKLISKSPKFLIADPLILGPKFEYLESLGIPRPDLANILSSNQGILKSSLTNRIIPNFDYLKTFGLKDENLVIIFKQCSRISTCDLQNVLEPKLASLRSLGMPEVSITNWIIEKPITLIHNTDRFNRVIEVLREMGFDPTKRAFVVAVQTMVGLSELKWERKVEVLKISGWSKEDIFSAFRSQPHYMNTSEEKIKKLMNFFVNKLGMKVSTLVKCPYLLMISLEKRIVPRCSVVEVLRSKGLMQEKDLGTIKVLSLSNQSFEMKYVNKFQEVAPEVLDAYFCKMESPLLC